MKNIIIWIFSFIAVAAAYLVYMNVSSYNPEKLRQISRDAFSLMNEERADNYLLPMQWDEDLELKALSWSQQMSDAMRLYHSDMDYRENIAKGNWGSGEGLYTAWRDSAGHHLNYMYKYIDSGAIAAAQFSHSFNIGRFNIRYYRDDYYAVWLGK